MGLPVRGDRLLLTGGEQVRYHAIGTETFPTNAEGRRTASLGSTTCLRSIPSCNAVRVDNME